MIQKKLANLISKYCMGIEPTDDQLDEIFDLAGEVRADPHEVAKYIRKKQNGPTREEVEAKKKAELEAKMKAEQEAKEKAELEAKKKAERQAQRKARLEALKKANCQKNDNKQKEVLSFWGLVKKVLSN